jgi:phosphoserine phosphatase
MPIRLMAFDLDGTLIRGRSLPRGGLGMPEFLRLLSAGVGCSRNQLQ